MSRLDELIQELCPNGVEYKAIGDCVHKTQNIKWASANGTYSYIDLTSVDRDTHQIIEAQTIDANNAPSRAQQIVQTDDVLFATTRPTLKRYCIIDNRYDGQICSTGFCVLRANRAIVLPRWLYHAISSSEFFYYVEANQKGASYPAISDKEVKQFKIPVPPLPVQSEIVRILDNFTELTARKKQYEFYRDKLLTFGDVRGGATSDAVWRTLGEVIVSLNTGLNPRQFFKLNTDDACNYYVTIREIQNGTVVFSDKTDRINDEALRLCNNRSKLEVGDVLFSGTGTIGETAVISEPPTNWNIKEGVYVIKPQRDMLDSRFLMYILRTDVMKAAIAKKVAGGTVKSIPMAEMRKLQLPVPPLDVQKRLVNVLDNFDAICSDLKIGLPAEIEARQKQYEFYRDALLTYAATGKTILRQTDRQTDRQTER